MNYANLSEMAAAGIGFSRQEITKEAVGTVTTTTVYAGRSPREDFNATTLGNHNWTIRRTVVTENTANDTTTIVETWATGSWDNRATLTYKYK